MTVAIGDSTQLITRKSYPTKHAYSRIMVTKIISLLDKGYSNYEIKHELKIDSARLERQMKRVYKIIRAEKKKSIDQLIFTAQRQHMATYNAAREEFEISKKDKDGKRKPGNPAYLQIMNESIRDLRKLLGLDKTVEVHNHNNTAIFAWDSLTKPEIQFRENPRIIMSGDADKIPIDNVDPIESRIRELEAKANDIERLKDGSESQSNTMISAELVEIEKPPIPIVEASQTSCRDIFDSSVVSIPFQEYNGPEQPKKRIVVIKKKPNVNPLSSLLE